MRLSLNGSWLYAATESALEEIQEWQGTMDVPSNWELQGLHNYSGTVWFKRSFTLGPMTRGPRHWLLFQGVDYLHEVYVNGQKVGEHEGYFQVHEFEVTAYLKEGVNEIATKVSSPFEEPGAFWPNRKRLIKGVFSHHDARPGGWSHERGQDRNTGGIWNDVLLYTTSDIKLNRCKVTPHLRGTEAVLTIETQLFTPKEQHVIIHYAVEPYNFESDGWYETTTEISVQVGEKTVYAVMTIPDPKLWWTWDHGEQPLYRVTVTVEGEDSSFCYDDVFGIREVYQDGKGRIFLNGREVFIRGTNYIPTQWLSDFTNEKIEQDIQLMKQANINGVRVHAHVTRDEFFAACDRHGLFVWQDFALQWSYQETDEFVSNAVRQIKEMVNQYYNHPSIMIWCCHNEPSTNYRYLDPLLEWAVREEDGKRIVKLASDFTEHVYPGWYHGSYHEYLRLPGAPFVTEFGAQALPNLDSLKSMLEDHELWPPKWERWAYHNFQYDETFNVANVSLGASLEEFIENSQRYQADLLKFAIENYRRHKGNITSLFQFMFVDCWPGITWSVLDYNRQPKKGYWALKQAYEPLLVTVEMQRKRVNPGHHLFKSVVAVNDYSVNFSGLALQITVEDEMGREYFRHINDPIRDIGPNEVVPLVQLEIGAQDYWKVPDELQPGFYSVCLKLIQAGKVLTSNRERFEVVEAVQKVDQVF